MSMKNMTKNQNNKCKPFRESNFVSFKVVNKPEGSVIDNQKCIRMTGKLWY